jgi:hypothetical protein
MSLIVIPTAPISSLAAPKTDPYRQFFVYPNKKKSDGARSGE